MAKTINTTEGSIVKSLFSLAIPILIANFLQSAYQLIDAYWVGKLGESAVASISVSFPITFLIISLGTGFAIAGSTLIAQYVGAKNYQMVNHVAGQTLLMVFILSILLGAVGYFISPVLLDLMGVAPDVFQNALIFMRITFVGLIFVFGFAIFQSLMRGVKQVTLPMYIVGGTVISNFIINPILIFGWGPIPAMGVAGSAIATLINQGVAAIIGLVILFSGKYLIHLQWSSFKPDFDFIKRAFFLGFPSSIEMSARALGLTVLTFLIASFGTLATASYGVGSNILQFVMIPAMGLSMATSALVGQNIGAGRMDRATSIAKLSAITSFIALTLIGVLCFIFAPYLIAFFVPNDPSVIAEGAKFVRTMSLSFGFMGVQMALLGVFRASGNMLTTMIISLVSQWVIQFPVAYILSKHTSLGIDGIWWGFPVANILICLFTVLWFLKGDWKKKRLVEETEDDKIIEKVNEEALIEEPRHSL